MTDQSQPVPGGGPHLTGDGGAHGRPPVTPAAVGVFKTQPQSLDEFRVALETWRRSFRVVLPFLEPSPIIDAQKNGREYLLLARPYDCGTRIPNGDYRRIVGRWSEKDQAWIDNSPEFPGTKYEATLFALLIDVPEGA